MNQPSKKELKAIFDNITKQNKENQLTYGRLAGTGIFSKVADEYKMSTQQVRNIFKGEVATWKKWHFEIYEKVKAFVKE